MNTVILAVPILSWKNRQGESATSRTRIDVHRTASYTDRCVLGGSLMCPL